MPDESEFQTEVCNIRAMGGKGSVVFISHIRAMGGKGSVVFISHMRLVAVKLNRSAQCHLV